MAAGWAARVTFLREIARFTADHMDRLGGVAGRTALATLLSECALHWLRQAAQGPGFAELATATAQLTHLLGQMSADAGCQGLAQRQHLAALALADVAGDRVTRAVGLRALSTQASRLGYSSRALHLAEAAAEYDGPAAVRSFVLAQVSVTRARTQDRRGAVSALARAEHHGERAWSTSAPGGPFAIYPPVAFEYQKAETLAQLGDRAGALTALCASLTGRPSPGRARALIHARCAELHTAQGDLDAACGEWDLFLEQAQHIDSRPVHAHIPQLRRDLAGYRRHHAVRDLLDRASVLERTTPLAR